MKKTTIKKIVRKKMLNWLDSITDAQLRIDVQSNLMVSGGCIASMFLNEKVNDFDVYLKDMNVLIRLAEYYCKDVVLDGRKKDEYLSKMDKPFGEDTMGEEFIRISNLKPDQVKLNIPSVGKKMVIKEDEQYQVAFLSQNAISLTDDVQII